VLQVEPTLPRYLDLTDKKNIYQFSAYPKNPDGTTAQYPPHLETIPKNDQVPIHQIFNFLGLVETQIMVQKIIPDTIVGKTANWFISVASQVIAGTPEVGVNFKSIEAYNRNNKKSGTDIARGANIGLLPDWYGDRRFAEQSFTGTNPTTITKCPKDLLTEFTAAAQANGYDYWFKTLPHIDPESLFVQDSRYFRRAAGALPTETLFSKEPGSSDNWGCAAVSLFQLHPDGKLHPIAIVCDYKESMKNSVTIFNQRKLPTDPTTSEEIDWPWRYAKTCAQVSDWLRHEVTVHLTNSHLIEEAIIVATHRTIPMNHIVFKLLSPHWYKTLSLNAAARATLVPQIIKDIAGMKPDYLFRFLRSAFEEFDFVKNYVPNDLKARGFPNTTQGLSDKKYKNYAYAKNITSMWACIRKYVMSMLLTYYDKDKADKMVQEDVYIKAWCQEVQTKAFIKSFPTINTLNDLCDAVTMCIHIAAPFHSTVNYLQNFYQSFVCAKPPSLCAAMPNSLPELMKYKEADVVKAVPIGRQRQWLLASQIPWLLSFKVASDRSLITFAFSQWRTRRDDTDMVGKQVRDISEKFYQELRELEVQFLQTSKAMDDGAIPYMVMDPSNTAVSILI
jgi:hypothetical protein